MSKTNIYEYARQSPQSISEEQYTDVGASFTLGDRKRAFLGSTFELRRTSGGALLVEGTDYELAEKDFLYSGADYENEDVWTQVNILNPTYQTGDLFVTYDAVHTYITSGAINDLVTAYVAAQGGAVNQSNMIWSSVAQIGSDTNLPSAAVLGMTALSGNRIAVQNDGTPAGISTYDFNGSTWTKVGNTNNAGLFDGRVAALSASRIAAIGQGRLETYDFDGTDWTQVGNTLSGSYLFSGGFCALTSTDVAHIPMTSDMLTLYRFDGTDWSSVFSTDIGGVTFSARMATLTSTDVVMFDGFLSELCVYRNSGSAWTLLGSVNIGTATQGYLTALNQTDVVFSDATNEQLSIYRWDGSTFSLASPVLALSDSPGSAMLVAALTGTDIAYIDSSNDDLRVYQFSWSLGEPYRPF